MHCRTAWMSRSLWEGWKAGIETKNDPPISVYPKNGMIQGTS
jgi:hypothetical protein